MSGTYFIILESKNMVQFKISTSFLLGTLVIPFFYPFMALSSFSNLFLVSTYVCIILHIGSFYYRVVTPHLRKESRPRSYVYLVSWVKIGFLMDDNNSILFLQFLHIIQISPNYLKPSIGCSVV